MCLCNADRVAMSVAILPLSARYGWSNFFLGIVQILEVPRVYMAPDLCGVINGLKPVVAMVIVQIGNAGLNIFFKLAISDGMNLRILVAYRYLFGTACLIPLAFFLERKQRPKLTWTILLQSFFSGLFGGSLVQNLIVGALKLTSVTTTSAIANLVPAVTFVLAVTLGMETLRVRRISAQAKVMGTLVGVGGAMLLTFYNGREIKLWSTQVNLINSHHGALAYSLAHQEYGIAVMGSLLAIAACFSAAIWFIIQVKMSRVYPCPYSSTTLMCLMASIQATIFALCMERDWSQWKLKFNVRLLTVIYAGAVSSALMISLMTWCIREKGPLYVSAFNPLMLVIVAVLGYLLLGEKLHVGSVLGAVLIVIGLYLVLWGKSREKSPELPCTTASTEPSKEVHKFSEPESKLTDELAEVKAP